MAFSVDGSSRKRRASRRRGPGRDGAGQPGRDPRNHRVEEALSAAQDRDDLSVLHDLLAALANPFDRSIDRANYRDPSADACGYRTFCGT
jgi:uncharacterized protein YdiU (UPF0061 family)